MATGDNAAHGALHHTVAPQGTAIYNLVNKDDLGDYFDNLAASATTEKVVLEKLTAAIAALTINNKAIFTTNSKLAAEVTNLTRRLGRNTDSSTIRTTGGQAKPQDLSALQKRGLSQA